MLRVVQPAGRAERVEAAQSVGSAGAVGLQQRGALVSRWLEGDIARAIRMVRQGMFSFATGLTLAGIEAATAEAATD